MPDYADFFSPDYTTARNRFRAAAQTRGVQFHELALDVCGPSNEALTIDIAWLGARQPRRVLLHSSGLHGVEAFAGSAIQLALLDKPPAMRADDALVLVHVLNPWGMAWLRRTNEHNVDLNRNFLASDESWSGAPPRYRELDPLLNPRSPPDNDMFLLRAAWLAVRHGMQPLKQAVAQGQYEFPHGLFYGGNQLEQGPATYLQWLTQQLSGAEQLFAIDVHTGLGRWGAETLIPHAGNHTPHHQLAAALNRNLTSAERDPSPAYTIRGGLGDAMVRTLRGIRMNLMLQELGTYYSFKVLSAMRTENRWHHYGGSGIGHPAKLHLKEVFCPASMQWRERVVTLGISLAHTVAAQAFKQE